MQSIKFLSLLRTRAYLGMKIFTLVAHCVPPVSHPRNQGMQHTQSVLISLRYVKNILVTLQAT